MTPTALCLKTTIRTKRCNFGVLHLTQPWICVVLLFGFPIVSSFRSQHTEVWSALTVLPFDRVKVQRILPALASFFIFLLRWPNRPNEPSEPASRLHQYTTVFSLTGIEWKGWNAEQQVGEKWWGGGKWGDRRKSFISLTVIIEL